MQNTVNPRNATLPAKKKFYIKTHKNVSERFLFSSVQVLSFLLCWGRCQIGMQYQGGGQSSKHVFAHK